MPFFENAQHIQNYNSPMSNISGKENVNLRTIHDNRRNCANTSTITTLGSYNHTTNPYNDYRQGNTNNYNSGSGTFNANSGAGVMHVNSGSGNMTTVAGNLYNHSAGQSQHPAFGIPPGRNFPATHSAPAEPYGSYAAFGDEDVYSQAPRRTRQAARSSTNHPIPAQISPRMPASADMLFTPPPSHSEPVLLHAHHQTPQNDLYNSSPLSSRNPFRPTSNSFPDGQPYNDRPPASSSSLSNGPIYGDGRIDTPSSTNSRTFSPQQDPPEANLELGAQRMHHDLARSSIVAPSHSEFRPSPDPIAHVPGGSEGLHSQPTADSSMLSLGMKKNHGVWCGIKRRLRRRNSSRGQEFEK